MCTCVCVCVCVKRLPEVNWTFCRHEVPITVCVCVRVCARACVFMQGLGSEFMLRTLSWRFNTPSLTLTAYPELPDTDHPTALRNALRQLSDLQVCGATQLQLKEWKWGAGEGASMSDAVLSALPTLPQGLKLSVYSDYQPITDESLGRFACCHTAHCPIMRRPSTLSNSASDPYSCSCVLSAPYETTH